MEQKILTIRQQEALRELVSDSGFTDYYLSGGTALAAYHLSHRHSDDLDFFTFEKPDTSHVHAFMHKLKEQLSAKDLRYTRIHGRNLFTLLWDDIEELKVEFTHYPFTQLAQPSQHDGIAVDSLRDIAANKLMALLDRFDPKDFVDLYFLLQHTTLAQIRTDAELKFGSAIESIFLASELTKVRRIEALPKMYVPLTIEDLTSFFKELVRQLGNDIVT